MMRTVAQECCAAWEHAAYQMHRELGKKFSEELDAADTYPAADGDGIIGISSIRIFRLTLDGMVTTLAFKNNDDSSADTARRVPFSINDILGIR
jgi:hypothetical protein